MKYRHLIYLSIFCFFCLWCISDLGSSPYWSGDTGEVVHWYWIGGEGTGIPEQLFPQCN